MLRKSKKPFNYYEGCYTYKQKKVRTRMIQQIDKHIRCMDCKEREMRKDKWSSNEMTWCKLCNRMCVEIDKCPKEGESG